MVSKAPPVKGPTELRHLAWAESVDGSRAPDRQERLLAVDISESPFAKALQKALTCGALCVALLAPVLGYLHVAVGQK